MLFLDNLYSIDSATPLSDTAVCYRIRLNPECAIFKAHFPGEPILPGACITQIVLELYSAWKKREAEICKISNLKFLTVISPDAVLGLDVNIQITKTADGKTHLKADIANNGTCYTKMSLVVC